MFSFYFKTYFQLAYSLTPLLTNFTITEKQFSYSLLCVNTTILLTHFNVSLVILLRAPYLATGTRSCLADIYPSTTDHLVLTLFHIFFSGIDRRNIYGVMFCVVTLNLSGICSNTQSCLCGCIAPCVYTFVQAFQCVTVTRCVYI